METAVFRRNFSKTAEQRCQKEAGARDTLTTHEQAFVSLHLHMVSPPPR